MTNEEQMKEKYGQFQAIQQQLEQVNEHLEMLTQQSQEVDISINAIKKIGETKQENEILAPVANGVFIKAKLLDNQKLVVNVGSDTTVEKTVDEVVKLLEEQRNQVNKKMVEADSVMQELSSQAMKMYQEIEAE
tara:strand:+ start:117 stop:518 length:402 start_codon:yes stop_codon:yes gene_type:complete